MTTTFPYGVVSSTLLSRTRRALPHAAQSLLDNGTVVAYAMTCVVDGDENGNGSTHWASGTAVCLPSPDGAVRWVWAYQAMVDSGVAGLTDAVVALTQPHAFSEDEVRQLWCVIRARSQTHAQVEVAVTLMRHTTWLGYDNVHELDGMCEDMARCQAMEGEGREQALQQLRANPAFNTGLVATLIHDPEQSRSGHERLAYLQAVAQEGALITPMTFIDHTPWPMVPPTPEAIAAARTVV